MPTTNDLAAPAATARASNSLLLSKGVARLETTLKLTTAILALAAGVYTYLGVRELLNGSPTTVFFAAVIYSVAVSVGIYAFWIFLMQFMPHVVDRTGRALMFGCMLLGSLMIVAMSSWLNASALAGAAAIQQHLAITVQNYTRDLDTANSNAIAAQGLLPDIQLASSRFSRLADAERAGSLTGTAGSGTVVQLLTQMSGQLDSLGQEVQASGKRVSALFEQGGKHLAKMRELISDRGPISTRSDAFATESLALSGVITNLQQTSVAPAVKRAATSLSSGFIAPAAGGRTADLADRQTAVVGKVESSIAAQAASLSEAADKILALPRVEPTRFQTMSPAEAVLALRRRFHPELGRRDLDRPDAGGAGADPVRGACRDPARGASRLQCIRHDSGRTGRGVADGPRGRGNATAWRRSRRSRLLPAPSSPAPLRRSTRTSPRCRQRGTPNRPCHAAICNDPAARP